jgi:hypothetical protein
MGNQLPHYWNQLDKSSKSKTMTALITTLMGTDVEIFPPVEANKAETEYNIESIANSL